MPTPEVVDASLILRGLSVGYGDKVVVRDVSFACPPGEVSALVGPNGAGKTTLLKGIAGVLTPADGVIKFRGTEVTRMSTRERVHFGISYVEQGALVFAGLSVDECLEVASQARGATDPDRSVVYDTFPVLKDRLHQRAGSLSGGERQMLAISMALMQQPQLVLLDEPSIGLAPNLVIEIYDLVQRMATELRLTVLVAEQNVRAILPVASRIIAMQAAEVNRVMDASEIQSDEDIRALLFA